MLLLTLCPTSGDWGCDDCGGNGRGGGVAGPAVDTVGGAACRFAGLPVSVAAGRHRSVTFRLEKTERFCFSSALSVFGTAVLRVGLLLNSGNNRDAVASDQYWVRQLVVSGKAGETASFTAIDLDVSYDSTSIHFAAVGDTASATGAQALPPVPPVSRDDPPGQHVIRMDDVDTVVFFVFADGPQAWDLEMRVLASEGGGEFLRLALA